jgi:hypothetical protein
MRGVLTPEVRRAHLRLATIVALAAGTALLGWAAGATRAEVRHSVVMLALWAILYHVCMLRAATEARAVPVVTTLEQR